MKTFIQLQKSIANSAHQLKKIKVSLLGDTSTQFLTKALKGTGIDNGMNLQIQEAGFDQIELQVFSPDSELYAFQPEIIIIFKASHKLLSRYNRSGPSEQSSLASTELQALEHICTAIWTNLNAKIIYYNYTEIDDAVYGNFANKIESSFLFQIRKLNYELMLFASKNSNLYICDISSVQNQIGQPTFFKPSIYVNTEMVISIDALPPVAAKTIQIINTLNGMSKKCVILDLDNTVWGGVIGDDGIENIQVGKLGIGIAFVEFQYWVKKLKNRGIIVAVCSKNLEHVAKQPFIEHPEMVLSLEDITVFVANWETKAENIRAIQKALNISFDSMVFIDDNPFERDMVRENIPGICVVDLPEDPADYLEHIYSLGLFETAQLSDEDLQRTEMYKAENKRSLDQHTYVNEDDFLKNLNMVSGVEPFNEFNAPRVSQLSLRSNQFNLRTIRYSDAEIKALAISKNHFTFAFSLEDKFGSNGLICVIILKQESKYELFIDSWFMSCRVLKRGVEDFVLTTILSFAAENGFTTIKGEYIPTGKNEIVKNHYKDLGFEQIENHWFLNVTGYTPKKNHIAIKQKYGAGTTVKTDQ